MFKRKVLEEVKNRRELWQENVVNRSLKKSPERKREFRTRSGILVKSLYTPLDVKDLDYTRDLGFSGEYPYTRGTYPLMYRTRMYTMRQYTGWGTAEETNQRFKYLLEHGTTALNVAYDLPTQIGYDPDHPRAIGEVGRVGVSASNMDDYERLFNGIPMEKISVHLQANANSLFMLAMYIAEAKRRSIPASRLWGACQNEPLKEFIARGTYIYPLEPTMRITCDVIEYCIKNIRRWQPVTICPYHLQEAGASFVTALGFGFAIAIEYIEELLKRGFDIDSLAYLISVWDLVSGPGFFEAICGFRALRRVWSRIIKERFGAKNPKSCRTRVFVGSGGMNLTAVEPLNNISRTTISAMAAALGGVQAMGIQCYDEAHRIPTDESIRIALRVMQIAAYESGVTNVVDPLGGSYFVEWLTNEIEDRVLKIIDDVDSAGGAIEAMKKGYFREAITKQAYEREKAVERGEIVLVGQNLFVTEKRPPLKPFKISPGTEKTIIDRLRRFKALRDYGKVKIALEGLRKAAESDENLVPYAIKAAEAGATGGEMADTLREAFGEAKPLTKLW